MTPQLIIGAYVLLIVTTSLLIYKLLIEQKKSKTSQNIVSLKKTFKNKKVVLDGSFKEENKMEIVEQLRNWNVEIEHKMSEKTGVLITGKNPDLMVIEDAKAIGAKILNEDVLVNQLNTPQKNTYIKLATINNSQIQKLKPQNVKAS
ncbi:hypothetical protein [Zunongwangia sp.]|uniref:hypothetical protein n=1 Tax=Zunongwangia sp. TaxID=1965325 RepID=UPI003AA7EC58